MARYDFRDKPVTTPSVPLPQTGAAPIPPVAMLRQGLPLVAGRVSQLLPEEQQALEKLGWKEGDPVPQIGQVVDRVLAEMDAAAAHPDYKTPARGPVVDIQNLPPEEQRRVRAEIQKVIALQAQIDQLDQMQVRDGPAADAINKALQQSVFEPATTAPTTAQPAAGQTEAPQPAASGLETMSAGPVICPQCGWDHARQDVIDVQDSDKLPFLASLLGGGRFTRDFDVFSGNGRVTFRNLTSMESELAVNQALRDAERFTGESANATFISRVAHYRMLLSIARITLNDRIEVLPAMQDLVDKQEIVCSPNDADGHPQTVLKPYANALLRDVLSNTSLVRVLSALFYRFEDLLRRLEVNYASPDFYKGIGTLS